MLIAPQLGLTPPKAWHRADTRKPSPFLRPGLAGMIHMHDPLLKKLTMDNNRIDQATHLQEIKHGDCIIVFDGYSGLGYENPEAVKAQMRSDIEQAAKEVLGQTPPATVWVVAGATADGIGMCYDVASELRGQTGADIKNVGIVSEQAFKVESWGQALPPEQSAKLDRLIVAASPSGSWQVIDAEGRSMMVNEAFSGAAHGAHARVVFLGGGAVAKSELDEIATRMPKEAPIQVEIHHGGGADAPNTDKAMKKATALLGEGKTAGRINDELDGTRDYQEGLQSGTITPLALASLQAKLANRTRAGQALSATSASKPT